MRQYSVSFSEQSVILPGKDRIRASKMIDDPTKFVGDELSASLKTVYDVLECGMKNSNFGDCAGFQCKKAGKFHWIKYDEFIQRTQYVGSAFVNEGLKPCHVGVFSANHVEFMLSLFGCAGYSLIMVPLYATLGMDAVHYIINEAELKLVVCDTNKNALTVLNHISKLPSLKSMVIIDTPSSETLAAAQNAKIKFQTFEEFEADGKRNKRDIVLPQSDDLFCIPYTSGTTGKPKGALITHRNAISCVKSLFIAYGPAATFGGSIVSYLPPAHIYEIMNEVISMYFGRKVAFFTGEIKDLFPFISEIKPTVVPLVPRLMTLLYNKVMTELRSNTLKWYMKDWALSRKEKLLKKGVVTKKTVWDKWLFRNFQNYLGGNAHIISSTSAPVPPDVMKFFRCASGSYIFEAYGQTEVLGSTMTIPYEFSGGAVGPPLPCNHVKLADVPEMGYFSKDDVGEVCLKGANIFKGYYKNPKATDESIDKDGWHHSGDIGRWLPNGSLEIIDRKKHLFKLSQGEYIAPEKVESVYSQCKLVMQVYVDGVSNENYVVTLVFPEPVAFSEWTKKMGFTKKSHAGLLEDKDVRRKFLQELNKVGRQEGLNSLEQAKNIHLLSHPFTIENEFLTPTLKLKRNNARKHFDATFAAMYKEGPLVSSTKT